MLAIDSKIQTISVTLALTETTSMFLTCTCLGRLCATWLSLEGWTWLKVEIKIYSDSKTNYGFSIILCSYSTKHISYGALTASFSEIFCNIGILLVDY